jgi:pSer/pThr/pTyr-binding forkhead associated (FHA) protein
VFPIAGSVADIGRDAANMIALPNDTNSSRRHATISINGSEYSVVDNSSSNGTFLNGVRIPANVPQPLRPGDEVQIGMTRFRFDA